nr:MAG TPA: hypothetical protein [Caudoviricetes sp.]
MALPWSVTYTHNFSPKNINFPHTYLSKKTLKKT